MPQLINSNIPSLTAQRNLNTSQSALSQALQRLSSGLRINSAKDDAAGLAIAERFSTQIRGLNQAVRNANDGISLAQTAEGALGEITNNLQRIRELSVQAANSTNSSSDRAALDQEVQQRIAEVERIASQTSFNGQKILDGTFGNAAFQVGANVGETIDLSLSTSMRATEIGKTADYVGDVSYDSTLALGQQGTGVSAVAGTAGTAFVSGDLTIALGDGEAVTVGSSVDGSAKEKAQAINSAGVANLTATADTTVELDMAATAVAITETDYDLSINGQAIYSSYDAVTAGAAITADELVTAINANASATGVVASYDSSNTRLTLTATDGRNIAITQGNVTDANSGLGAAEGTNNTSNTGVSMAAGAGATVTQTFSGSVRMVAAEQIVIGGTDPAKAGFTAGTMAVGSSALNSASVTTVDNANTTINRVDSALTTVSTLRSTFGAVQNRFESVIANLQATSENMSASRSRVVDADFAAETAALTRAQILQQAGVAMLSQANSLPQNVLSLLR